MAKGGEGLGIALPPQTQPDKASFDIRSGALAKWLKALPTVNTAETTKQLYQALLEVNRHSHDWQRRYHFLEAIREPLDNVQKALNRRYTGQSFPLPAKTQQIATLSQRLHLEMAYGYLAAIDTMLAAMILFQDRSALKIMLHRACRYLNQNLLVSYQTYTQQSPGVWQQLHRIYAFAEERNIHQDSIRDPLFEELPKSSIARIYKQIALLATVSPFRLRQGEAAAIHQALANWSTQAKMLHSGEAGAEQALFAVNLLSDEEPDYRALAGCSADTMHACRLIDTRQLVKLLEESHGFSNRLLTPELAKSLVQCWSSSPTRSEQRNQEGTSIEVTIGMGQIHLLLAPSLQNGSTHDNRAQFDARPAHNSAQRTSASDIWNIYSGQGGATGKSAAGRPSSAPTTTESAPLLRWQVRDRSPGGMRVALPEGQEGGIRIGELLAMHNPEVHEAWQLGQIRWLRRSPSNGLECGVQILAPQMIPVMLSKLVPGRPNGESQRGLLLPEDIDQGQPASLIAPQRSFAPAETVLLHAPGNEIVVVLESAIQENGTFVQFEFHAGSAAADSDTAATKIESPSSDKVWELL